MLWGGLRRLASFWVAITFVMVGTTTASATTFIYDLPAVVRVDAHDFAALIVNAAQLNEVRERSASPSVEVRGPSPIRTTPVVATNTADDVIRLGTQESWGNQGTLARHFRDHGADFAANSADDYARVRIG